MKTQDMYIASEKRRLSFGLAVLMHAVLLLFLFFGMRWQNQPVVPLEVEMWGEIPAALQRQGTPTAPEQTHLAEAPPPIQQTPADVAEAKSIMTEPPQVKPDIVEAKEKRKEVPKKEPETKPVPEKRVVSKTQEVKPKDKKTWVTKTTENNKTLSEHPLDMQNLIRGTAVGSKQGKSAAGSLAGFAVDQAGGTAQLAGGSKGRALDGYINQLKQLIRGKTVYADNGSGNPSAVLKIFVLPDGTIREVHIVRTIGDPAFAHARKQALLMMQRLPPLPTGMRFSEEREWTVHTRLRE